MKSLLITLLVSIFASLLGSLVGSSFAQAAEVVSDSAPAFSGKVTQVFRDKARVVVQADKGAATSSAVGAVLTITAPSGEACEGTVLEKTGAKYLVDLKGCSSLTEIKAGAHAAPSEFSVGAQPTTSNQLPLISPPPMEPLVKKPEASTASDRNRAVRFSFGVYYSLGDRLKFSDSDVSESSLTSNGSISYKLENAFGAAAEVVWSRKRSWGVGGGLATETKRKFKEYTAKFDGEEITRNYGGDSYFTFSHVYANAIYRWDAFYLPFGINFLLPKVEDGPLIFKNKSGSVGGQVGAGYYVHENFATEFVVRASHVNLGGVASGTNYYSYGDGYLFSANLIAKFIY